MSEQEENLRLLKSDPHGLVIRLQPKVEGTIRKLFPTGKLRTEDFKDLVQAVNEKLLGKMPSIQRSYSGRALLSTYISRVLVNICHDIRQSQRHYVDPFGERLVPDPAQDPAILGVETSLALDALKEVLALYYRQRPRLLLFLKIYYDLPISAQDILSSYPACPVDRAETAAREYQAALGGRTTGEMYAMIAPLVNQMEGTATNPDGYRKWTWKVLDQMIRLLNRRLDGASLTPETFRDLFEVSLFR